MSFADEYFSNFCWVSNLEALKQADWKMRNHFHRFLLDLLISMPIWYPIITVCTVRGSCVPSRSDLTAMDSMWPSHGFAPSLRRAVSHFNSTWECLTTPWLRRLRPRWHLQWQRPEMDETTRNVEVTTTNTQLTSTTVEVTTSTGARATFISSVLAVFVALRWKSDCV